MSPPVALTPALPLHSAGPYVAAAYIVVFVLLLVYLAIMAVRAQRVESELQELQREVAELQARNELDAPDSLGDDAAAREQERAKRSGQIA